MDQNDELQRPHRDALTDKVDTGHEPVGADAGTGAGAGVSASGVEATSVGPDAERVETGRADAGARDGASGSSADAGWQGGDPGIQADEGFVGRGGTGSLGSGGVATPQADPAETSWQDEAAGSTGGAQGQEGVSGGESWEGRDRDTGESGFTTGDAGFGSNTADDGGQQRHDGSDDRADLN